MLIVIVLFVLCIYAVIGGFLAAAFDWTCDEELYFMVCLWPIIVPIVCLAAVGKYSARIGIELRNKIINKRRQTK